MSISILELDMALASIEIRGIGPNSTNLSKVGKFYLEFSNKIESEVKKFKLEGKRIEKIQSGSLSIQGYLSECTEEEKISHEVFCVFLKNDKKFREEFFLSSYDIFMRGSDQRKLFTFEEFIWGCVDPILLKDAKNTLTILKRASSKELASYAITKMQEMRVNELTNPLIEEMIDALRTYLKQVMEGKVPKEKIGELINSIIFDHDYTFLKSNNIYSEIKDTLSELKSLLRHGSAIQKELESLALKICLVK